MNTHFYKLDITKDSLDILIDLPEQIDALIYCPGSINLKPFNRLSIQDFLKDFNQNVLGAVSIIQKALPNLKANGASIVLFSSVAAKIGLPYHSSISTSKAAIEGLALSLAAELASFKIRVNVIAPSLIDTPLTSSLLNTIEKEKPLANVTHCNELELHKKLLI